MRCHLYEIDRPESVRQIPFNDVSVLFFVSRAPHQRFEQRYPEFAVKTQVIPNAVDTRKFGYALRRECGYTLGMLGRIFPKKDQAAVLLRLRSIDKRWRLVVQGSAPRKYRRYLAWLKLLRWCLRLGDRVDFLPHTEEPLRFYRAVDAVVSNSRDESFHMSVAEGMACGCWPVIRDWDGARDIYPSAQIYSNPREMRGILLRYERMTAAEREAATRDMRAFVEQRYGIPVVGERIEAALAAL